ncbi:conjugal transfer protein TraK [Escherichia coli]|uniref:TraK domain-containing protein n=1 Tax=Edwardsiella TaxID=635 RepID=UPI0003183941|nr:MULTISPECIES: type-F conjugative transfer system secretin TraK [Edwardsiella]EFP0184028.1 conjugal transfer protein TraK [Escherichia coli]EGA8339111.1 conjugal transfer protein TraK [Salmonella enterica subsp. enterica serovar Saintpaul]EKG9744424.1 type-F conjugative transfer system secretin TraK [Salmonella enterica]EKS7763324.1 type-F conjugative transfer system secretin TraK [Edwardsiella ictaluri]EKS7789739.1 type-F conjugative transfer system secretin TraK [Edwardsiella ictaluri]
MSNNVKCSLLLVLPLAFATSLVYATDDIPVVPESVMKKNVPAPVMTGQSSRMTIRMNESALLTMKPGVNQIIPIAIGHPNRIVTPFSNPEVVSTSLSGSNENGQCGEICIKENVVYVATDKESPVTAFITEKGSEAQSLSLTMVPRRIPPREVFLKLDSSNGMGIGSSFGNSKAETWETSQPYVETVRTVFRKIALGEIPQGYTINRIPSGISTPSCAQPGVRVDFSKGQYVMGHHLNVFIGVAENVANQPIEIKEAMCGGWDVAAVTSWPYNVLEPGQKTEIYVAKKQLRGTAPTSKRPSLLGGVQ